MNNWRPQTRFDQMRNRLLPNLDAGPHCPTNFWMNAYLRDVAKFLSVSTYELSKALPPELRGQMNSVDKLERELQGLGSENSGE